eukprot:symbB.v1.2.032959.t1/scaffold3759.1/size89661/5
MRLFWLSLVLSLAERLYPVVREEDGKKIEKSDSNVEIAHVKEHDVHQHSASSTSEGALLEVSLDSTVQGGEDPVEEPNAEKDLECVNGILKLKGTYQVHSKEAYHLLSGCHRVIAEDANLELFAPLVFNSTSLEFEGHLTMVAKAPMAGSCLRVSGQLVISGDFFVKDCQNQLPAKHMYAHGGGIHVLNMMQRSGKISIENCSSKNNGGAIYVEDSFTQEGGEMMIKHCQAGGYGGGVYAKKNFTQNNGVLQVEDCSAQFDAGALYAKKSFRQTGGKVTLSNCKAFHGGGLQAAGDFEQLGESATASVENCSAEEDGGGLYISKHSEGQTSPLGRLEFHNCSAGGRGGGVFIEGKDGAEFMARQMYFHHCRADREGGAFFAERMSQLDHVTLDLCNSGGSGAMTVYNDVNVSDLTVVTDADSKGQAIMSGGATVVESLNCTGSGEQMCEVASSTNLSLPNLWCPDGAERKDTDRPQKVACSLCGNGYVRLIQAVNPQCQPCPPQATQCVPTKLTMPAGMTVDANNFSLELYCPNPAACPGGYLLASSESKMSKELVYHAMCDDGYVGDDCSKCAESHGKADYNPLTCLKSIIFYVLKDLILFASAVASTLTASAEKKHSAVLLNQLLAFATVANIVTTGVMQTRLFAGFHEDTRQVLQSLGLLVNAAQAQADGGTAKDCLLRHFGFPTSLLYAHLFSSIFPLILIAALAVFKGPKLSLVLGVNVFLPGFTAAFGKYLIAFRCKPESEGGNLLTPFLPEFPGAAVVIPFAIVLCFVLGALGWWLAVHTEAKAVPASGKEPEMPPYVLFLTGSYKSECRAWEIERLVRKMLLSLLTATIPVSYSPALQMLVVSGILIVSMGLHYHFMPYKVDIWNRIEYNLLAVALLLTCLTTALVAHDLHFARSKFTASCLIVFMISLLAAICGTMILLVVLNIYREWQSKRRQAAETNTA